MKGPGGRHWIGRVGKANGSRERAPDDRLRVPTTFHPAKMVGTAQERLRPPYAASDRHCERSEAIQSREKSLDCFVASLLAMTGLGSSSCPGVSHGCPVRLLWTGCMTWIL